MLMDIHRTVTAFSICCKSTDGWLPHPSVLCLAPRVRATGYMFIALFCVMTYLMTARIRNEGGDISPTVTLHVALAMVLSPLLFIKVLIARYYQNQHGLLMPIGLAIFVLAFVLVASTAGP
jgi:hypothetical protein